MELSESKKRILIARPYDDRYRSRVLAFLRTCGLDTDAPRVISAGKSDNQVLEAVASADDFSLLLLPFHQHITDDGSTSDGMTLAAGLKRPWCKPIVMPVSAFAFASSFPRRLTNLVAARTDLEQWLVPLPPDYDPYAVGDRIQMLFQRSAA